jgi:Leucine-rich repeat (LRR) protein
MKKLFAAILICLSPSFLLFAQEEKITFLSLEEAQKIHPDSVFTLSLKKSKLEILPAEIYRFKNLRYLDLSFNKLTNLDSNISNFSQLKYLDFSKNKFETFPSNICQLENMEVLKFNRNSIQVIDSSIIQLQKLTYIDFWDNPIKTFPTAFLNLKSLKIIHAEGIKYSPKFQEKWISALDKVTIYFDPPCDCVD